MTLATPSQRDAIEARGNVLVVAGAGTGKTRTLVDRCVRFVLDPENPIPLERILMVTFTEAAAAEMRQRIRLRLEHQIALDPANDILREQVAALDGARISTMHGFCLHLIREQFHSLRLDPEFSVLDEGQGILLAQEVMDRLFERAYESQEPEGEALQRLIREMGRTGDRAVRELVWRLHRYTQSLAHPEAWFQREQQRWEQPRPAHWRQWWLEHYIEWRASWSTVLPGMSDQFPAIRECWRRLSDSPADPTPEDVRASLEALQEMTDKEYWPRGSKPHREAMDPFFETVTFLLSVADSNPGNQPLDEDWQWTQPHMLSLLQFTREFGAAFAQAKRDQGTVDFADLEQLALNVLWGPGRQQVSEVARQWRSQLDLVFVDEYQDINEAQDAILHAVSGTGDDSNRFLVGDIKQSIYRFRLADPGIFLRKSEDWRRDDSQGRVVALADNFRSRPKILDFVNAVFEQLMHRELGGVAYLDGHQLKVGGNPDDEPESAPAAGVEVHLLQSGKPDPESKDRAESDAPLSATEREAFFVGRRVRQLHDGQFLVRGDEGVPRPMRWSDVAVLLRAPSGKAEVYAKVFAALDIPLDVERVGFFEAEEVCDLVNVLRVLDNPLQDLPLLAVLRSPLAGFTTEELAFIRQRQRRGSFWAALERTAHPPSGPAEDESVSDSELRDVETQLPSKVSAFLAKLGHWREAARRMALSQSLELILDESYYESWLEAQPRGAQRLANLRLLLQRTRQFDPLQRQGLFRFLQFVDAQQQAGVDPETAISGTTDQVRLLSVHRSKGLEFPVVIVADLGKRFNFTDSHGTVVLDEQFGLCPQIRPPHQLQRYPSLAHWLAQKHQRRETLGEELRLLYVAMTRARDLLILTGTASRKAIEETWPTLAGQSVSQHEMILATCWLDWLGPWLHREEDSPVCPPGTFFWETHTEESIPVAERDTSSTESRLPGDVDARVRQQLDEVARRLAWQYPHQAALRHPAKGSVTALRHLRAEDEHYAESQPLTDDDPRRAVLSSGEASLGAGDLSSIEIGLAHHAFLEHMNLDGDLNSLEVESTRLVEAGVLSPEEVAAVDLAAIRAFWESEVGARIRARAEHVHRELPFTARFSPRDLEGAGLTPRLELEAAEFMVIQGAVDLVVLLPEEIWLLDFKTDRVAQGGLQERVDHHAPQLRTYGLALERIYRRPVTALWLHFLTLGTTVKVEGVKPRG